MVNVFKLGSFANPVGDFGVIAGFGPQREYVISNCAILSCIAVSE